MILHEKSRLSALGTAGEALRRTWALRVPYIVLTVLLTIPNVAITEIGLYDPLNEYTALARTTDDTEILTQFPFGTLCLAMAVGFALLSAFGIFWYRYMLLEPTGALKFNARQFLGMLGRFSGYGLLVMIIGVIATSLITLFACLLGKGISGLVGASGTHWGNVIVFGFAGMAYVWLLGFAVRISLVFPAIALGNSAAVSESWAATKKSEGSLLWAVLLTMIPLLLLSFGVYSALSAMLGTDLLAGATVSKGAYWWVDLALSPIANLPLAVTLGVIAIAYRNLTGLGSVPVSAQTAEAAPHITA